MAARCGGAAATFLLAKPTPGRWLAQRHALELRVLLLHALELRVRRRLIVRLAHGGKVRVGVSELSCFDILPERCCAHGGGGGWAGGEDKKNECLIRSSRATPLGAFFSPSIFP